MYVVLASKSPRRLELLSEIVPLDRIRVIPPKSAAEAGFEGLETLPAIEQRLLEIVHNFIVFDAGVKKICRPNQYFGVHAAQERVVEVGELEQGDVGRALEEPLEHRQQPPRHHCREHDDRCCQYLRRVGWRSLRMGCQASQRRRSSHRQPTNQGAKVHHRAWKMR